MLRQPSLIAFASIALTEWRDPGQLARVLLRAPVLVANGAVAAQLTKAVAAIILGTAVRRHLNERPIRIAASLFCLVSGLFAEFQFLSS